MKNTQLAPSSGDNTAGIRPQQVQTSGPRSRALQPQTGDASNAIATPRLETSAGWESIKPKKQKGHSHSYWRYNRSHGDLLYWVTASPCQIRPTAHILVCRSLAENAGLAIYEPEFGALIDHCAGWRLLYKRTETLCFRLERAFLDVGPWKAPAFHDIEGMAKSLGYPVRGYRTSDEFTIHVSIHHGMPLPICKERTAITDFAIVGEGLNFSLDAVAAKGGAL